MNTSLRGNRQEQHGEEREGKAVLPFLHSPFVKVVVFIQTKRDE
jgi:hypothetical protein